MNIYFAGSLFTLAERRFNAALAERIAAIDPSLTIFLPQTCDGDLLGLPDFAQRIYSRLIEALDRCDIVVAILDGLSTDSGTCIELGYAHAAGKKIIGVRTDSRGEHTDSLSPQTFAVCDRMVCQPSPSATIESIATAIVEGLRLED